MSTAVDIGIPNIVRHSLMLFMKSRNPKNDTEARDRGVVFDALIGDWDWLEEADQPERILEPVALLERAAHLAQARGLPAEPVPRQARLDARRALITWQTSAEPLPLSKSERSAILRVCEDMVASGAASFDLCRAVDDLREVFARASRGELKVADDAGAS